MENKNVRMMRVEHPRCGLCAQPTPARHLRHCFTQWGTAEVCVPCRRRWGIVGLHAVQTIFEGKEANNGRR